MNFSSGDSPTPNETSVLEPENHSYVGHAPIPKVWIMLPAFNEAANIASLINRIDVMSIGISHPVEIVVVDDGSSDETAWIVENIRTRCSIKLVQHYENQGLAGAIRTCFRYALDAGSPGDIVITMDADDTQPPATIPAMVTRVLEGLDVVIASRYQPESRTIGVPPNRLAMTWFAKWLFKTITPISGVWDYTCGFRAYRFESLRSASEHYGDLFVSEKGFSCMVDVLLKMRPMNFVFGEVPMVLRYDQKGGVSKMNVSKTMLDTLKLLIRRRFMEIPTSRIADRERSDHSSSRINFQSNQSN